MSPADHKGRWPARLIVFSIVGVAINVWLACNLYLPGAWNGRNDFLGLYAGGKLAGSSALYDAGAMRRAQWAAVGEAGDSLQFSRLPYCALLLKPLAQLPYHTAYTFWIILSSAAFVGFAALWPAKPPSVKWPICAWAITAFVALFNGQDVLLVLFWAALSMWLLRRGNDFAAGLALAMCASKYHLAMMVPVVILAQRRWRLAGGAILGGAILIALSFAGGGADWPSHYFALLADSRIHPGQAHMPNLHSLIGTRLGFGADIAIVLALAVGVYVTSRRTSFERAMAFALVAGVLGSIHTYLADCALLLPAIISAFHDQQRPVRLPAVCLATPVPWFLLQMPTPLPVLTQLLLLAFLVAWMAVEPRIKQA